MSTVSITSPTPKYFELTYKSTAPPVSSIERLVLKSQTGLNAEKFIIIVIEAGSMISYLLAKPPK